MRSSNRTTKATGALLSLFILSGGCASFAADTAAGASQDTNSAAGVPAAVPASSTPAAGAAGNTLSPATTGGAGQTNGTAAATAGTGSSSPAGTTGDAADAQKYLWKPGQSLTLDTDTEDIAPTYDIALAKKQVDAYPDSPEASFILAVALTRTSRVEEALKEVQRARKLAEGKGGPAYFDKMIAAYEKMLTSYPDDNRVRYGLAWAYYMKAYLLAQHSRRIARWKAANPQLAAQLEAQQKAAAAAQTQQAKTAPASGIVIQAQTAAPKPSTPAAQAPVPATRDSINKQVVKALGGSPVDAANALSALASSAGNGKGAQLPHIPGALENVEAGDVAQIKQYFEQALLKIDEILKRDPSDVWSIVYGAHLKAEYTGNLEDAMKTWRSTAAKYPNNPAPYFFMGEGYLKQGNLKESINNVSRAIALRALGN